MSSLYEKYEKQVSHRPRVFLAAGMTLVLGGVVAFAASQLGAPELDGKTVGMTYYGGHRDENGQWFVDNAYQCDRIKSGEISATELAATPTDGCSDDPGVGNFDNFPLHDMVSYAELSKDPATGDFSALGNLPRHARLQIENLESPGRCVVAEKLDVGLGGPAVDGHQRSIDLWWQTGRTLGFDGLGLGKVTYVDQATPLTPLGQTAGCVAAAAGSSERTAALVAGSLAALTGVALAGTANYTLRRKS